MPAFESGDGPTARLQTVLASLQEALSSSQLSQNAQDLLQEARAIVDQQDPYLERISTPAGDILEPMIEAAEREDWAAAYKRGDTQFQLIRQMCAGTYEASVMQQFARMSKAKTILEIGMFAGTTTVALALLPEVDAVTPLELEPYLLKWAMPWWEKAGVAGKIHARIGDAQKSLKELAKEGQTFDMVFIDADKGGYAAYYDLVMDLKLLNPRGVIVADNTAYRGAPWAPTDVWGGELGEAISQFNEKIRNDSRVDVVLLPVRDGMSLIQRRT